MVESGEKRVRDRVEGAVLLIGNEAQPIFDQHRCCRQKQVAKLITEGVFDAVL